MEESKCLKANSACQHRDGGKHVVKLMRSEASIILIFSRKKLNLCECSKFRVLRRQGLGANHALETVSDKQKLSIISNVLAKSF